MSFLGNLVGGITGGVGGFISDAVSPLLSAGNGMLGDALTGGAISNAKAVADTNQMQMQQAQKQMDFQERMSNSAYQRAVVDMRAAGLNPALAYQNGPASAPSGAQAQLTAPRPGDVGAGLFNSAKTIATMIPEIENTKSQTSLNQANADVADVQAQKLTANAKESEANTAYTSQLQEKAAADTKAAEAQAKIKSMEADVAKKRYSIDKSMAVPDAVMERIEQLLGSFSSAKGVFSSRGGSGGSYNPPPRRTYGEDDMLNAAKGRGVLVP